VIAIWGEVERAEASLMPVPVTLLEQKVVKDLTMLLKTRLLNLHVQNQKS
jgi:hypothetical protein